MRTTPEAEIRTIGSIVGGSEVPFGRSRVIVLAPAVPVSLATTSPVSPDAMSGPVGIPRRSSKTSAASWPLRRMLVTTGENSAKKMPMRTIGSAADQRRRLRNSA
jgi:hypothetical protein